MDGARCFYLRGGSIRAALRGKWYVAKAGKMRRKKQAATGVQLPVDACFCRKFVALELRLGGGQGLEPCIEAALVAGGGVGVQNALLNALVQR